MRQSNAEEKIDAFHLITRYPAFEELILGNYPFDQDWVISYIREHHYKEDLWRIQTLNENENLKVDWVEMFNGGLGFICYPYICHNKVAVNILQAAGIKIDFVAGYNIVLQDIKLNNSFLIRDLVTYMESNVDVNIFKSKEIWDFLFKHLVDDEMINAWMYYDSLNKEIELYYNSIENERILRIERLIYENEQIAQSEYENNLSNEENIIDTAFEGDPENIWNVD